MLLRHFEQQKFHNSIQQIFILEQTNKNKQETITTPFDFITCKNFKQKREAI